MSMPNADRPRYRPVKPTPEQEEMLSSLLDRLASPHVEPSSSEIPSDPAEPTES